jgi:nucleotide-binding universal stress UspA family protein
LVIVPGDGAMCPRRIVVAFDGSLQSQAAVQWLADMAANLPVHVNAVTVHDTALPMVSVSRDGWAADAEWLLRTEWASALNAAGVGFEVRTVEHGPVVDGVLEVARHLDADVVVIVMQGTSAVSGIRIGGKALQLLHCANVTVAVVPPT